MNELATFFSLDSLAVTLRAPTLDISKELYNAPSLELAPGLVVDGSLLPHLYEALAPDLDLLRAHPEALMTCLYAQLHWHDAPNPEIWQQLLARWEEQARGPWLRALLPPRAQLSTAQQKRPPRHDAGYSLSTPCSFSPDSSKLLALNSKVWSVPSGALLCDTPSGPRDGTDTVSFSEDGLYCIQSGCDYMGMTDLNDFVQIFEIATGTYVFMEDNYGCRLNTANPATAKSGGFVWSAREGGRFSEQDGLFLPRRFITATTSPDRRWVAATEERTLHLFEVVRCADTFL